MPRVIVVASDGLLPFRDERSACLYMEPVDVAAGEYVAAYTVEGRRLQIAVENRQITIAPSSLDSSGNVGDLEALIKEYLLAVDQNRRTAESQQIAAASLNELVEMLFRAAEVKSQRRKWWQLSFRR